MTKPTIPAYRFSAERREDLARLGVTERQIEALEAVLPSCHVLIEDHARLTDTRNELEKLIRALGDVQRVFQARIKAAREALNRWQMAAHARGHPLGSDPGFTRNLDLDSLVEAARDARRGLASDQRRSHAADPEPIRRIADALMWGAPMPYLMPPRQFREIVQIAYEAMGAERDYVPEKALRGYRRWRKIEATRRAAARATIT